MKAKSKSKSAPLAQTVKYRLTTTITNPFNARFYF
jgi:hypothetical protein